MTALNQGDLIQPPVSFSHFTWTVPFGMNMTNGYEDGMILYGLWVFLFSEDNNDNNNNKKQTIETTTIKIRQTGSGVLTLWKQGEYNGTWDWLQPEIMACCLSSITCLHALQFCCFVRSILAWNIVSKAVSPLSRVSFLLRSNQKQWRKDRPSLRPQIIWLGEISCLC